MAVTWYGRGEWGGRDATNRTSLAATQVRGVAVHWNGPAVGAGAARGDTGSVASYLRGVQRFHMDAPRGYADIAYNLAVDAQGGVWELRGLRTRSAANGDATTNSEWVAVLAVIGQGQKPTEAMADGLRVAVGKVRDVYPSALGVRGHTDVRPTPTECPGADLLRMAHGGRFEPRPAQEGVFVYGVGLDTRGWSKDAVVGLWNLGEGKPANFDVVEVQRALNDRFDSQLTVDGVWGALTQARWSSFRERVGTVGDVRATLHALKLRVVMEPGGRPE